MANERSLWRDGARLPAFAPLHSDLRTDVLIVGGGLAGILCAHMLRSAGVDCALVEAANLCGGVTQNTTAKLTVQHGLIYHKLMQSLGRERAQMYLCANQRALDTYRALCAGMDCDFEAKDNLVYSVKDGVLLDCELAALQSLGVHSRRIDSLPLPIETAGAVCVPNQAQFDPLKFAAAIAKELPIYEHTRVLELAPGLARTPGGGFMQKRSSLPRTFPC
ncbi:MAG: NAD(P)/FAD-dependent oxidoreductase [Aristaeellaceae bacterium]